MSLAFTVEEKHISAIYKCRVAEAIHLSLAILSAVFVTVYAYVYCAKIQDCDRVPVTPSTQLAYGKLHYDEQIAQIAQWIQTAKDGLPNHLFCNSRWVPRYPWDRR